MAKIILEPDEVFEHLHDTDSYTILLKGKASYTINGKCTELQLNDIMLTPSATSHIITNLGDVECIVECGHGTKS